MFANPGDLIGALRPVVTPGAPSTSRGWRGGCLLRGLVVLLLFLVGARGVTLPAGRITFARGEYRHCISGI